MKPLLTKVLIRNLSACRLLTLILSLWLLTGIAHGSPQTQKRVLLLYDVRRELPGNMVVDRTMRTLLADAFGVDVDVRSEYFEPTAYPKEDYPILLSWLRRKYARTEIDVIVPVGSGALQFVRQYGLRVFHNVQVVYWGRRAGLETWDWKWPITGVLAPEMESSVKATFSFIRGVQPDLQHIAFVSGTSPIDRLWEAAGKNVLSPFQNEVRTEFLAGLTLEEVEKRLKVLPPRSAIFIATINEDGTGRQLLRSQFLNRLTEQSNAPVYSTSALYLNTGIVGGALADQELMTMEAADIVVRLLRGEDIRNIPLRESRLVPMANLKAMKRWGLKEANLPGGTVIVQREQSIWDTYRWHIAGVVSLCILEATLIVALLIHRAHRRRAEKALIASEQFLQATIDALNVRVAILDQRGNIVAANRRWKSFAKVRPEDETLHCSGANYFEISRSKAQQDEARLVSEGLRRVITYEAEDFRCVYPCLNNDNSSWFQVRINRFDTCGTPHVVVTQEDVTEIKQAHDALQDLTALLMRAQDEERRRIARDLHDVTVQNMVAIKGDLSRIERESTGLERELSETLNESLSLCNQVIHELRTLSYVLHPPLLDEAGLVPALQWFVRGFIQRSGVPVELLIMDDIGRLPGEVETALFRVVQESLTNMHRHSGSRSGIIWVSREHDNVILRVVDEGHGFSHPKPEDQSGKLGVGIQSMRERLRQLGGDLEIESSSKGTTVYAKVSISEEENAAYLTR